jgi:hypothetical protein
MFLAGSEPLLENIIFSTAEIWSKLAGDREETLFLPFCCQKLYSEAEMKI